MPASISETHTRVCLTSITEPAFASVATLSFTFSPFASPTMSMCVCLPSLPCSSAYECISFIISIFFYILLCLLTAVVEQYSDNTQTHSDKLTLHTCRWKVLLSEFQCCSVSNHRQLANSKLNWTVCSRLSLTFFLLLFSPPFPHSISAPMSAWNDSNWWILIK